MNPPQAALPSLLGCLKTRLCRDRVDSRDLFNPCTRILLDQGRPVCIRQLANHLAHLVLLPLRAVPTEVALLMAVEAESLGTCLSDVHCLSLTGESGTCRCFPFLGVRCFWL